MRAYIARPARAGEPAALVTPGNLLQPKRYPSSLIRSSITALLALGKPTARMSGVTNQDDLHEQQRRLSQKCSGTRGQLPLSLWYRN